MSPGQSSSELAHTRQPLMSHNKTHTLHITHHTLRITHCTLHVTRYVSHIHVTHYISHVTLRTTHCTLHITYNKLRITHCTLHITFHYVSHHKGSTLARYIQWGITSHLRYIRLHRYNSKHLRFIILHLLSVVYLLKEIITNNDTFFSIPCCLFCSDLSLRLNGGCFITIEWVNSSANKCEKWVEYHHWIFLIDHKTQMRFPLNVWGVDRPSDWASPHIIHSVWPKDIVFLRWGYSIIFFILYLQFLSFESQVIFVWF